MRHFFSSIIILFILFFQFSSPASAAIYSVLSHEASSIYRNTDVLNDIAFTQNGSYKLAADQGPSGNYYILDPESFKVYYFDDEYTYLGQFGSQGSGNGQFTDIPTDMEIDSSGNIFVLDPTGNKMVVFSSTGVFIRNNQIRDPDNLTYVIDPHFDLYGDEYFISSASYEGFFVYDLSGVLKPGPGFQDYVGGDYSDSPSETYIKVTYDTTLSKKVVYLLQKIGTDYSILPYIYNSTNMYYYSTVGDGGTQWLTSSTKICSILPVDDELYVFSGSACTGTMAKYQINYHSGTVYPETITDITPWNPGDDPHPEIADGIERLMSHISTDNAGNLLLFYHKDVPDVGYFPKLLSYTTAGELISSQGWDGVSDGQFTDLYDLLIQGNNLLAYGYNPVEGNIVQKFDSSGVFVSKTLPVATSGRSINANSLGNIYFVGSSGYKLNADLTTQLGTFIPADSGARDAAIDSQDRILSASVGSPNRFTIYNSAGTSIFTGSSGPNDLVAIATDPDDYIYVASGFTILKYNSNGSAVGGWSATTTGQVFQDIVVYKNLIFATKADDTIHVYSTVDGSETTSFGSTGTGAGQYDGIGNLTVDSVGNLYVIDENNNRIQKTNVYYQVSNVDADLEVFKVDNNLNVEEGTANGIAPTSTTLQIRNTAGIAITDVDVNPNTDIDFSSVTADTDLATGKSYIANLAGVTGVQTGHDLYVPIPTGLTSTTVVVCPNATTLSQVSTSCPNAITLTAGVANTSLGYSIVANKVTIDTQLFWKVEGLQGTGAIASNSTTSSSSSSSSSNSSTNPSQVTICTGLKPTGKVNLFQIDTTSTDATLYFAPSNDNRVNRYLISYSTSSTLPEHNVFFDQGTSNGVLSYTIHSLKPGTTYYFRVQPFIDCVPGDDSNQLVAKTSFSRLASPLKHYSTITFTKPVSNRSSNLTQTQVVPEPSKALEPTSVNQVQGKPAIPPVKTLRDKILDFFKNLML